MNSEELSNKGDLPTKETIFHLEKEHKQLQEEKCYLNFSIEKFE